MLNKVNKSEGLPFSVQHPNSLATLGWQPNCNMMSSSFSKSSEASFSAFTAHKVKAKRMNI